MGLYDFPWGGRVWIFKDGEEFEVFVRNDAWYEEKREELETYARVKEWRRVIRNEPPRIVAVEVSTDRDQETELSLSEAVNKALFSTVAKLSQELDELREG